MKLLKVVSLEKATDTPVSCICYHPTQEKHLPRDVEPMYCAVEVDENVNKEIFEITGKISTVARYIVGGEDINGFSISVANVHTISKRCEELKALLDQYDRMMVERTLAK